MPKRQKKNYVPSPSGRTNDGKKPYYPPDDLKATITASASLKCLPVDGILMLHPSYEMNDKFGKYKGEPVPFLCLVIGGSRGFRCKHDILNNKGVNTR